MSRVILPGSEKATHPNATVVGSLNPSAYVVVTVIGKAGTNFDAPVTKFASDFGLKVVKRAPGNRIYLAGTIGDLSAAFGIQMDTRVTDEGVTFRHRSGVLTVPADLEPYIMGVFGLDNRPQAKTHVVQAHAAATAFYATQIAKAYRVPTSGTPRAVGIIELGGGYGMNDITTACASMGASVPPMVSVGVDGGSNDYSGNSASADGEVSLDVQVIAGVNPGGKQVVYFAPNTDQGFIDAILDMAHDTANNPVAGSISWGAPEDQWTAQGRAAMDMALAACVKNGIPVFAAAGDHGSSDDEQGNHADYPASSPNCIGCGGTNIVINGDGSYASESVWHEPNGSATGGGVSSVYQKPSWQAGNNQSMRGVPDISSVADPQSGYLITINGQTLVFGGTSAAAPFWAGLTASLVANLGVPLGDLLPRLYGLPTSCYHDITVGDNGAFSARPGYDFCTGLGTPIGRKILAALQPPSTDPNPPGNPNPPASLTVTTQGPPNVTAGNPATLSAFISGANGNVGVTWDFGDGSSGANSPVNHVYAQAGSYTYRATAIDSVGASGTGTGTIEVTAPVVVTPPSSPDWTPDLSKPLGEFVKAMMDDPSILDPGKPAGSLLKYIIANPDRFQSNSDDAILFGYLQQYFEFFAQVPQAMIAIFDSPSPGTNDLGWGATLSAEGAA